MHGKRLARLRQHLSSAPTNDGGALAKGEQTRFTDLRLNTRDGLLVIQWTGPYHNQVFWGTSPDVVNRALALGFADGAAGILVVPDPTEGAFRPYLKIVEHQTRTESAIFAERTLPLESIHNFRDIGGIKAGEMSLRWGKIFRHGRLSE